MQTTRFRQILLGLFPAAAFALSSGAFAQDYPGRPIKFVIPFPPGGGVDLIGRLVADKLQAKWGQPVISENRAGANGNIGSEYVAKASPDGYTALVATVGQFVISKLIYKNLSFDPDTLVPVSVTSTVHQNLTVNAKVPGNTVQELVTFLKANPDRYSYASAGVGSAQHLAGELFQLMSGTKLVHVPYKGTANLVTDLLSGQVSMAFIEIHNVIPHLAAGKLRVLAVGSENRLPTAPDIPAMSETYPGFAASTWNGVALPPGTPPAIVTRLSAGIAEALRQPDVMKRLGDLHVEVVGSTPAEMAQLVKRDAQRWGSVVRATGATAE